MNLWTVFKVMIAEPYCLLLFILTGPGWCYLALFLSAILCLVFAVKKGSSGLLTAAYVIEVLPLAFSVWHCHTSDDFAAILTGMASVIYLIILAITVIVHLRYRHRFKKIPLKESDWPVAPA